MKLVELERSEYPAYYQKYINHLPDGELVNLLMMQKNEKLEFLNSLNEKQLLLSYSEEKWTVAEVLQHLLDTERIFQYRALHIARKDEIPLPGFDQDLYVPASYANERTLSGFIKEYEAVRDSGIALFKSFTENMLMERGISSGGTLSVAASGFIIAGHEKHHIKLFKSNYGL